MEDAVDDSRNGSVCINTLVIPALDKLRNNPLEDLGGDLASTLIENLWVLVECLNQGGLNLRWRNDPWTT